jgi:hypothetical protein
MAIARDDYLGGSFQGAFEDSVIVRIAAISDTQLRLSV